MRSRIVFGVPKGSAINRDVSRHDISSPMTFRSVRVDVGRVRRHIFYRPENTHVLSKNISMRSRNIVK